MLTWLISYPRSGNTLLRIILKNCFNIKTYSIYNDPYDIGADENTKEAVGHLFLPEDFNLEKARESPEMYYIKSHSPYNDEFKNDKVIYIMRDGRYALISLKHYLKDFHNIDVSFLDLILKGDHHFGTWDSHIKSWTDSKYIKQDNLLMLKYEQLVNNPEINIKSISEFINIPQLNFNIPTFDELHGINPKFFRQGRNIGWQNEMSVDEHNLFWLLNHEIMLNFGYKTNFPEFLYLIKETSLKLFKSLIINEK